MSKSLKSSFHIKQIILFCFKWTWHQSLSSKGKIVLKLPSLKKALKTRYFHLMPRNKTIHGKHYIISSLIILILFIPYILTLYLHSDKMYNSITLIVQFHGSTCFEPLIWVHLQGLITHYSHQLVQLFTWIIYICVCMLSKIVLNTQQTTFSDKTGYQISTEYSTFIQLLAF
jgi:hypothetical protein